MTFKKATLLVTAVVFTWTLSSSIVEVKAQDTQEWEILTMVKYPNYTKKMSGIYVFEPGKDPVHIELIYGDPIALGTTLNLKMNELYAEGWSLVECIGTGDNISEYTFKRKK